MWSRKYDKAFGWQAQRERELGSKFRKNKALTCKDLASIVEWKLKDDTEKKVRSLELVARNDEANVIRLTGQALSIPGCEDNYRMNCLTLLEGVSPIPRQHHTHILRPQTILHSRHLHLESPTRQRSTKHANHPKLPQTPCRHQKIRS